MEKKNYIFIKGYSPAKKNIKTIVVSTFFTLLVGLAYALLFESFHPHVVFNAALIGFLIGFLGSMAEVYFFQTCGSKFRFSVLLISRTLFHVTLIASVITLVAVSHTAWMKSISFWEALKGEEMFQFFTGGQFLRIFVYAVFFGFLINFIRQINKLLGQNVLLKYITGKYHQPVEEERVFMFLDLTSSTSIAEELGNVLYHKFLNDFFFDITPAIVENKGQIYQYVGDEVVISWTKEDGLNKGNCIKCYFQIAAIIRMKSGKYLNQYNIIPKFKAGYHFGKVITGEIGDIKKEIVFHGDTVNTAARIRSECTRLNKNLLLSSSLLNNLADIDYLSPERIGKIKLRGKEEEIELFSILEAA